MNPEQLLELLMTAPLSQVQSRFPVSRDFFLNLRLPDINWDLPLMQALDQVHPEILADFGLDHQAILRDFSQFLTTFGREAHQTLDIRSLTILGGHDKSGTPEVGDWTASVGEVISIVGPTGSGKSRLLADIECLADGDSPTGRRILVDGRTLSPDERLEREGRLVAQLSQNMNFVMDLTVREFLEMHAESRQATNVAETIQRCFDCATDLAGEKFTLETKVTQLSGGQSRALMIADTAFMSASPVVLIDEIENAGIDRRRAIEILARKEKIVFLSTHDPLLALSAGKRLVIRNGGVQQLIVTSPDEKECLQKIERLDAVLFRLRFALRHGERISNDFFQGGNHPHVETL